MPHAIVKCCVLLHSGPVSTQDAPQEHEGKWRSSYHRCIGAGRDCSCDAGQTAVRVYDRYAYRPHKPPPDVPPSSDNVASAVQHNAQRGEDRCASCRCRCQQRGVGAGTANRSRRGNTEPVSAFLSSICIRHHQRCCMSGASPEQSEFTWFAGCRKLRGKRKGQAKSPAAGSSEKKLVRTPSKRIGVLTDEELTARSPCCDARCHNVPMAHVCATELYELASHEASCTCSWASTSDTGTLQQPQQRQQPRQQQRQQSPSRGPMARSQRHPRRSVKRSSHGRQVGIGVQIHINGSWNC